LRSFYFGPKLAETSEGCIQFAFSGSTQEKFDVTLVKTKEFPSYCIKFQFFNMLKVYNRQQSLKNPGVLYLQYKLRGYLIFDQKLQCSYFKVRRSGKRSIGP
jgi:hypothetical protein